MRSLLAPSGLLAAFAAVAVVAKPEQIRTDQDPVYHYYLQAYPQDPSVPVMGPVGSSEYFNISGSIQSTNTSSYLNIMGAVGGASYLTLAFNKTATTTAWALEGDTIITSTSSSYGRQLNFLACQLDDGDYWQIYLQTGSDVPSGGGATCSNYQTLHLPCLC
ncbi:hypothetical protein GGR56DRAFT_633592 [Xylariaceae sp. FL0804]|nr:hypothetical protein GGR56DRAFT_633592 [Xylariaceae sp. FL0804]